MYAIFTRAPSSCLLLEFSTCCIFHDTIFPVLSGKKEPRCICRKAHTTYLAKKSKSKRKFFPSISSQFRFAKKMRHFRLFFNTMHNAVSEKESAIDTCSLKFNQNEGLNDA